MSLHSGIDTIAFASNGAYTKTYGSGALANIANLFVSLGLSEDAPTTTPSAKSYLYRMYYYFKNRWRRT